MSLALRTPPRSRRRGRRAALAIALGLALAAPAAARAGDETPAEILPGRSTLPGTYARESFERTFVSPNAHDRWRGLPLFGHELFEGAAAFSPSEQGPVGPDYVLGPGDQLVVFVSAWSDSTYALTLDREGRVFLPRFGSLALWGLALEDAERLIRQRLEGTLRNARVQVSMGRLRALDVFVLGEVASPGKRTLSGLATAFHALLAAGGPTDRGSARDVRVLRANREIARFDLYPFLTSGDRSSDVRLQSGDVVFVGERGPRVGIQGAVQRAGVYEARGPLSLAALLALAGGPTPFADLARVRVERVDANGGFRLQDLPLDHGHGIDPDSLFLNDFDLVTLLPLAERVTNVVTLDGYVRHEGEYELTPGLRLKDLVTADRLQPEAALDHAEFRRVTPGSFAVEVRSFAPRDVLDGRLDWELRPLDAVTIFSSARRPHSVTLSGEVVRPGVYAAEPGERLSSLIARAGGLTPRGALGAAVFTRPGVAASERRVEGDYLERQRAQIARERVSALARGDTAAASAAAAADDALVRSLAIGARPGRVVLDLDEAGRWAGTARDPVLADGDQLHVPERPQTVAVLGEVRNPGTLLAKRSARGADYVRRAGGATRDADLGRSYVLRANGAAVPFRGGVALGAGDAVVVVARATGGSSFSKSFGGGVRWAVDLAVAASLVLAASR